MGNTRKKNELHRATPPSLDQKTFLCFRAFFDQGSHFEKRPHLAHGNIGN
jgi:hypothetical protein